MGVRTDTETNAGSTVGDGAEPCELGLVDGEVRARGAPEPLVVEDLVFGRRRKGLCLKRPYDTTINARN